MSEKNLVCAILDCEGECLLLSSKKATTFRHPNIVAVEDMMADLKKAQGVDEVSVLINAECVVVDIRINELSIGYFATGTYCKLYELEQAKRKLHGEFTEDAVRAMLESDPNSVAVPLFAEGEGEDL